LREVDTIAFGEPKNQMDENDEKLPEAMARIEPSEVRLGTKSQTGLRTWPVNILLVSSQTMKHPCHYGAKNDSLIKRQKIVIKKFARLNDNDGLGLQRARQCAFEMTWIRVIAAVGERN
jgi:hypothetical protein